MSEAHGLFSESGAPHLTPYAFSVSVQNNIGGKLLGFKAETSLDAILDEVIPWIVEQVRIGGI